MPPDAWWHGAPAVAMDVWEVVSLSCCVRKQVLAKLLDRSHLEQHKPAPYPAVGVGYEVVRAEGSGLLSGVE